MARIGPGRAFRTRDAHRRWLTLHFALYLGVLVAAFFANRSWTPEVFWVQWVALGGGILLAVHGVIFARSTLATMGGGGSSDR